MPYCCQCGSEVRDTDRFCGKCGGQQTRAGGRPTDYLSGVSDRTASLLCYIPMVGWIAAIIVLASERFRTHPTARFNAFQGLYLFVAWLIVSVALTPFLAFSRMFFFGFVGISAILKLVVFCTWIFMIIKVSQDETFKLPILGELAERSVSEQR